MGAAASNNAVALRRPGSTELTTDTQAIRSVGLVMPAGNPKELIQAHKAIAEMVNDVLEEGTDYGTIPGTDKKALLNPGAERLTFGISATPQFEVIEQEIDHDREVQWEKRSKEWYGPKNKRQFKWVESSGTSRGLYRYVLRCRLVRRADGALLGEGVGSCSSLEGKYIDRPRELENTILKMAKKRAHTDAILTTLALSGRFAPDGETDTEGAGDESGVIADPTDGLTLAESLARKVKNVPLGEMKPKSLQRILDWVRSELQEDPDNANMVRLAASIDMVQKHRETNPLADAKAEATTTPPAAAAATSTEFPGDVDDESLPFD